MHWNVRMVKVRYFLLAIFVGVGACSTTVHVKTDPQGVDAYYRGHSLGKTPVTFEASDALWEAHFVTFKKDRRTLRTVQLRKEFKTGAIVGGFCLWPVWGWSYGPAGQHNIDLRDDVDRLKQSQAPVVSR